MWFCVHAQVVTYQPPFVLGAGAYTQINAIYPGNFVNNSGVTTTWQPAASRPTLPDAGLGIIAVSHLLFHSHQYGRTLLTSLCTTNMRTALRGGQEIWKARVVVMFLRIPEGQNWRLHSEGLFPIR